MSLSLSNSLVLLLVLLIGLMGGLLLGGSATEANAAAQNDLVVGISSTTDGVVYRVWQFGRIDRCVWSASSERLNCELAMPTSLK